MFGLSLAVEQGVTTTPPIRPIRSLSHPLWLISLALLVLNDHLFKGSATLPSWFTGKLSDFAGPIVAAALLAVLLRTKTRKGWLLSHLAVAAGFAVINLSPLAASSLEALAASTPWPWFITVDPSDLIGLVALPVSFLVLGQRAARQEKVSLHNYTISSMLGKLLKGAAVPASALACMATSPPPCEDDECRWIPDFPTMLGALALTNNTQDDRLFRVRSLRQTVTVDCESVLADPAHALSADLFDDAATWFVEAQRAIPLPNNSGIACTAYLVETDGMAPTLLVWDASLFPNTNLSSTVSDLRQYANVSVMSDWLILDHPQAFYLRNPEPAPTGCELPDATTALDWSSTSNEERQIIEIDTAPNGCHQIKFDIDEDLVICMPVALPFEIGEQVRVDLRAEQSLEREAEAIEIIGETKSLFAARGSLLPPSISRIDSEACVIQQDECGNSARTARVINAEGEDLAGAGDTLTLTNGDELHLVRVQQMPARDLECAPAAVALDYIEYVLISTPDSL